MTGSAIYQIKPWTTFESSFQSLIKTHYRKSKRKRERQDFQECIADFLDGLKSKPRAVGSAREPAPKKCSLPDDCEFRKMRWRHMPGLSGEAAYVRLMYLVFESTKRVYPFWIYTHSQYRKRPPDREILKAMSEIIRWETALPSN